MGQLTCAPQGQVLVPRGPQAAAHVSSIAASPEPAGCCCAGGGNELLTASPTAAQPWPQCTMCLLNGPYLPVGRGPGTSHARIAALRLPQAPLSPSPSGACRQAHVVHSSHSSCRLLLLRHRERFKLAPPESCSPDLPPSKANPTPDASVTPPHLPVQPAGAPPASSSIPPASSPALPAARQGHHAGL